MSRLSLALTGVSLLVLGLLAAPVAATTCEACAELAAEVERLRGERERVQERLALVEASIERSEASLTEVRSKLTERVVEGDFENPEDHQRNVEFLTGLIRAFESSLAEMQDRRAELEPRLAELEQRLREVSRELEECESEECGAEPAEAPCIDPLDLPEMPHLPPAIGDTECSPCEDLLEEYRRLHADHVSKRREFSTMLVEAHDLHAAAESTCRNIRALERSDIPVPEEMRRRFRQRLEQLERQIAQTETLWFPLDLQADGLEGQWVELRDCLERYCGEVFQEFGSGGLVPSPSAIGFPDFGRWVSLERSRASCPPCQGRVDQYNRAVVWWYNEMVRSHNELVGRLEAIGAELTEISRGPRGRLPPEEIARLQEEGLGVENQISQLRENLISMLERLFDARLGILECEVERCVVDEPGYGIHLLGVRGEGANLFVPEGVEDLTSERPEPDEPDTPDEPDEPDVPDEPAAADLAVEISGPGSAAPGEPVRYDVRVENLGPDEATGTTVEITVPTALEVTGVGAGCTRSGRTVACDLGDLAAGSAATAFVEGTIAANASGTLTVEAEVSSDQADPNAANNRNRQRTRIEEDEPPPPEPTGCAALSGTFTGDDGCGIGGPLDVSTTDGGRTLVLDPLGENGRTRFSISGDTATSESTKLIIFGEGDHVCKVTCEPPDGFLLHCESTVNTKTCDESFSR